jgi:ATP/ADP translocase
LQVLGWGGAALATPLVMLVSGAIFFAGSLFPSTTALPGTALALMLALGPAAGIVAQVRLNMHRRMPSDNVCM